MEVACLSSVKLHLCYEALVGTSHVSSDSQVSIELLAAIVLEVAPHFMHLAHTPVQLNAPAASMFPLFVCKFAHQTSTQGCYTLSLML